MKGQEKITLNLNALDLAKVDYLAEQGFYSSRSDFIRMAIRNQLREHEAVTSDKALVQLVQEHKGAGGEKALGGVGIVYLNKKTLENQKAAGTKTRLFVVGSLFLSKDVTAELLSETLDSARIYGAMRGPNEAVDYLRDLKSQREL